MDDRDSLKKVLEKLGIPDKYDEVLAKRNIHGPTTKLEGEHLVWLDLSRFGIKSLPDGIFDELKNLRELKLFGNEISELPERIFSKLTELTEVHLKDNKISKISKSHFESLSKLSRLFLLGNPLPNDQAKVYPTRDAVVALINSLN